MKIEGRWLRPEESVAISGSRQASANCGQYSLLKPTTTTAGIVLKLALVLLSRASSAACTGCGQGISSFCCFGLGTLFCQLCRDVYAEACRPTELPFLNWYE